MEPATKNLEQKPSLDDSPKIDELTNESESKPPLISKCFGKGSFHEISDHLEIPQNEQIGKIKFKHDNYCVWEITFFNKEEIQIGKRVGGDGFSNYLQESVLTVPEGESIVGFKISEYKYAHSDDRTIGNIAFKFVSVIQPPLEMVSVT